MPKQGTHDSVTLAMGAKLPAWFHVAMDKGLIRLIPSELSQMRWGNDEATVETETGRVLVKLGDRVIYRDGKLGVEKR